MGGLFQAACTPRQSVLLHGNLLDYRPDIKGNSRYGTPESRSQRNRVILALRPFEGDRPNCIMLALFLSLVCCASTSQLCRRLHNMEHVTKLVSY